MYVKVRNGVINQLHVCWFESLEFLEYPLFVRVCVCVFVCVFVCFLCMCLYVCVCVCKDVMFFKVIQNNFYLFLHGCDNVVGMISYRVAACMHVSSEFVILRHCIRH